MRNYLKWGTWNSICDVCGQKYKADELRTRWDGLEVCKYDYEPRHPQDLIRIRPERGGVGEGGITRTESTDTFVTPAEGSPALACTIETMSAYAGLGAAGCMRAGFSPSL